MTLETLLAARTIGVYQERAGKVIVGHPDWILDRDLMNHDLPCIEFDRSKVPLK